MRLFIASLLALVVVSAHATTTLDFNDLSQSTASFQTQGYEFTAINGFFANVPIGEPSSIAIGLAGGPFEMAQVGHGAFSIYSLDMATDSLGDGLILTGNLLDGGQVTTTFVTQSATFAISTFSFGSQWQGLTSISMTTINTLSSPPLLDNIVVSSVPIPAAAYLFFSALAGIGLFCKRRQAP